MAVVILSAGKADIPQITKVLTQYLLETELVQSNIDLFIVAEYNKKIIGCACLDNCSGVLELISIAVLPGWKNKGVGRKLVNTLRSRARGMSDRLYVRTTASGFFSKMGFIELDNSYKPNIWQDCACCDKLEICKQVPMVLELR
jgi:amino-acid N-acetyltransferase